jgi:hypothetical protein
MDNVAFAIVFMAQHKSNASRSLGSVEAVELFEATERRAYGVIMWLRSIKQIEADSLTCIIDDQACNGHLVAGLDKVARVGARGISRRITICSRRALNDRLERLGVILGTKKTVSSRGEYRLIVR